MNGLVLVVAVGIALVGRQGYLVSKARTRVKIDCPTSPGGWDARNKTVLVTGSNIGLGKQICKDLIAETGVGRLIMTCRDEEKCASAAREILRDTPHAQSVLDVRSFDLASFDSIRSFARNISDVKIDVLINNAAVVQCPYWSTDDGFEMQMGVNHLGTFLLTRLLLENIRGRIVHVSSQAAAFIDTVNLESYEYKEGNQYDPMRAYQQSKLANVLFSQALQYNDRMPKGVTSNAIHPGVILTTALSSFVPGARTEQESSLTILNAALSPDMQHVSGAFLEGCDVKLATLAFYNRTLQESIWNKSSDVVGLER